MADKSTPLILNALTKAMADPVGVPLHGNKKTAGLFAASASAKQAARRCVEEGYLRVLHRQTRGKSIQDVCTISEKGLAYLLSQVSPKAVLEELVRTLGVHKTHVAELVAATRRWQAGLDGLQTAVLKVLEQISTDCRLQIAELNLQSAICNLQSAIRDHPTTARQPSRRNLWLVSSSGKLLDRR